MERLLNIVVAGSNIIQFMAKRITTILEDPEESTLPDLGFPENFISRKSCMTRVPTIEHTRLQLENPVENPVENPASGM